MKAPVVFGIVISAVLVTVGIEEMRMYTLRDSLKKSEAQVSPQKENAIAQKNAVSGSEALPPPEKTKSGRLESTPAKPKAEEPEGESFVKTIRKMGENPSWQSMMKQQMKMAVNMLYQDLFSDLSLNDQEAEYFKDLLGKQMADQQQIGMKLLGASETERETLAQEIENKQQSAEAEIKTFLNSDADYQKFTSYKNHLPEHQQIGSIRAAMQSSGAPIDAETEKRLVETMYQARIQSGMPETKGPNALQKLADGSLTEAYENSWGKQQEALRTEASKFLNETQVNTLLETQKQANEVQMMGLKMAEQMMKNKKE